MADISQEELNQRVALLKKFKTLLEQQRGKFQEYLNVLEKQQTSITSENSEALIAHTELEQQVVKNISNLQKVIIPMSTMYKLNPVTENAETESINKIQEELSDLQNRVLRQNQINRELLREHIENIRAQIQNFKNPYATRRNVYSQKQPVAQMVEVQA